MTIIMKNGSRFDYPNAAVASFVGDKTILIRDKDGENIMWLNMDDFSSIHYDHTKSLQFMVERLRKDKAQQHERELQDAYIEAAKTNAVEKS